MLTQLEDQGAHYILAQPNDRSPLLPDADRPRCYKSFKIISFVVLLLVLLASMMLGLFLSGGRESPMTEKLQPVRAPRIDREIASNRVASRADDFKDPQKQQEFIARAEDFKEDAQKQEELIETLQKMDQGNGKERVQAAMEVEFGELRTIEELEIREKLDDVQFEFDGTAKERLEQVEFATLSLNAGKGKQKLDELDLDLLSGKGKGSVRKNKDARDDDTKAGKRAKKTEQEGNEIQNNTGTEGGKLSNESGVTTIPPLPAVSSSPVPFVAASQSPQSSCVQSHEACCATAFTKPCAEADTSCWWNLADEGPSCDPGVVPNTCSNFGCRRCVGSGLYQARVGAYIGPEDTSGPECKMCCPGMASGDACNGGLNGNSDWKCLPYTVQDFDNKVYFTNELICTEITAGTTVFTTTCNFRVISNVFPNPVL
eukprot:gb/GEZN01007295.1/.p1 GENE.gb/GEZN01007295.1/~~gb/GEZN01007295.1/.p1  ORF type:complete len:429 (+),score=68.53 gb/GEZN01007295.1/:40-1326(+)